ncbi:TPA: ead/Ea22-like family protein [Citrobacter koseri]
MSNIDKQALRTVAMLAKELSGISMYSKNIAATNKFHELFTPDVALALLDELESKQTFQQAFFRQSLMYDVVAEAYEEAKEQIAKDVEIKARLCRESNSLFDRLRAAEKRIAELEARAVKLPPTIWYDCDGESQEIAVLEKRLVEKAVSDAGITIAAGINMEAE